MRLTKSLLCGISALMLATGAAFAGQDSTVHGSVESTPPELLSNESFGSDSSVRLNDSSALELSNAYEMTEQQYALEESDVIDIYPMEVTEYYLVIPSQSSEMPG